MAVASNPARVLTLLILFRLINTSLIWTFFQPDEYYQSLEPAWKTAFGPDSGAYVTWEWKHQLRSSLHPWIFAGIYKLVDQIARILALEDGARSALLIFVPKGAQAVFAALGDWFTWRLAGEIYGPASRAGFATLWMTVLNPWQWYCSVRTFSNSLEMTLTIAALYFWPWELSRAPVAVKENPKGSNSVSVLQTSSGLNSLRFSLFLAGVAVLLRPTNLLIWVPVFLLTAFPNLVSLKPSTLPLSTILIFIREIILCGSLALGLSVGADRLYFDEWTFPPYKWLHFNIAQSLAVFYGRNPWHYYLLQGIPLLCTTLLPFVGIGFFKKDERVPELRVLPWTVYSTVAALSLISHKEVRFIYPLLPILHIIGAQPVADFFTSAPAPTPTNQPRSPSTFKLKNKPYLAAGLLVNLLLASYLGSFHQAAPISVLTFLRNQYILTHTPSDPLTTSTTTTSSPNPTLFALLLLPCHSTPWASHLTLPIPARALTCDPPLHTLPKSLERSSYRDEADRFYDDPVAFLAREIWGVDGEQEREAGIPTYIVGFEGIEPTLFDFFNQTDEGRKLDVRLRRVWEGWNGLFNEDWRRRGRLVVWETGRGRE